jgi:uncharacterized repeat protein (TIGR03803 family)
LNISNAGPRFGSTKLAAAIIRGALTLAVLSALLLIGARPAQAQTQAFVLYGFCSAAPSCPDGQFPLSGITSDGEGNLFGTTSFGGSSGAGTVFDVLSGGGIYTLYTFCPDGPPCPDGRMPGYANLLVDSLENLYGTTTLGGANGYGVVWELTPEYPNAPWMPWNETVLYSFTGAADGWDPESGLIMDPAGNLYGTTKVGGGSPNCSSGCGTVFELTPSAGGVWDYHLIYTFDTQNGIAGLTMDGNGNIYGATLSTVFELSPDGNGGWTQSVLHTFTGAPGGDGSLAQGTPALDQAGNLYGTTASGGAHNGGMVYKLVPAKNGTWTEQILYSFKPKVGEDGYAPIAGVVLDENGNIYGTTTGGTTLPFGYVPGTVFELVAPHNFLLAAPHYKEKILANFCTEYLGPSYPCVEASEPTGILYMDGAGNLYGTARMGPDGPDQGVVFEVTNVPPTTKVIITSSPNPSVFRQPVVFTVVVIPSFGWLEWDILDWWDWVWVWHAAPLGPVTWNGSSATLTTSALPVGSNRIWAVFDGVSNFPGSKSQVMYQVVGEATTTTTLVSSQNPSILDQSVTFTASVSSQSSATATGTVTFFDGTTALKTVSLKEGAATFTTSALPAGTDSITATYNGSRVFVGSSASLTQTVNW